MTALPAAGMLSGLCGALAGTGLFLAARAAATEPGAPGRAGRRSWTQAGGAWLNGQLAAVAGPARARRLLLADDLAIAGRDPDVHTALRLGCGLGLVAATTVAVTFALPDSVVLAMPLGVLLAALVGVALADRPVRQLAQRRRQETRLASAAYLDLARVLLASGLPLHAALRLAADAGHGWAFTQIRGALDLAAARQQPPDVGFETLAARVPLTEWRELRLTVTSALRGASPVEAMSSKAVHLRAAEAAQARADAATADAELELPAAAVALVFVVFLTYPLLSSLSSSGLTP